MTINEIIEDTVNKTVEELKKNKIINDFSIDYYTKTERLLQSYNELVKSVRFRNEESSIISMIDEAIKIISNDPYINIIKLYYFDKKTINEISLLINLDNSTVYRHRKRLVTKLSIVIFGDPAMIELIK